jgi:hypothetical protein
MESSRLKNKRHPGKLIEMKLPPCSFCNGPVELETSKTDEDGKAIHEECYVRKLRSDRPQAPATPTLLPRDLASAVSATSTAAG